MKILVDPQIYNSQVYGGVSRYYTEVFSELEKKNDVEIEIPIFFSNNEYLKVSSLYKKDHKKYSGVINLISKLGISTRKMVKKKSKKKAVAALKKQCYDVFIPTYYDTYFLEYTNGRPYVLTIYDMIHELFPQYFNDAQEIAANKLLLMKNAAKIIAVSHNTKKDIIRMYPEIEASKIEVVYHGSSIAVDADKKVDLPENYILFVGVRNNYKNFEFLVESVTGLFTADETLQLLCAGGGKFTKRELELLAKYNLSGRVIQKNFDENELGQFYKNAKCFVFPSAYEGFGIPVLEAMACGCPIVLTNNSSFPEVAGEAGIYYELGNKDDLKNKIEYVVYNESVRKEYSARGLQQVQKFTWKEAANECYAIYKEAAGPINNVPL